MKIEGAVVLLINGPFYLSDKGVIMYLGRGFDDEDIRLAEPNLDQVEEGELDEDLDEDEEEEFFEDDEEDDLDEA